VVCICMVARFFALKQSLLRHTVWLKGGLNYGSW
jgi:hypothetical protein